MTRANVATRVTEGPWAGWTKVEPARADQFFSILAPVYVKSERGNHAIVAVETRMLHSNYGNVLHGGFLSALADQVAFQGLVAMGHIKRFRVTTIESKMHFIGGGKIGVPVFVETDVLKEDARLVFMRMTLRQEGDIIASATATLRKTPRPT